ncbi:MAG: ribosomal protein S18-alanine N-acetyltransferase [Selenomonas sp.]|nr:ribosomal protein S18-alanine N-acetyltransferase [Selenomonas sp.]MDD7056680.1 ribosomal protein S18-alanine N-acetyltransferase [Selenomonadaceae bacterium]
MSVSFREMVPDDADVVAAVEAACFPVPWSRESFWREASNEHTCYRLAVADEQVVGFAGCWVTCDEAQITNIALLPDWRGQGLGTRLMADLMAAAKARGCTAMTLEVRPSNTAALALYHHYGFKEAGRRKGYYTDNGEDAIIMWLTRL